MDNLIYTINSTKELIKILDLVSLFDEKLK